MSRQSDWGDDGVREKSRCSLTRSGSLNQETRGSRATLVAGISRFPAVQIGTQGGFPVQTYHPCQSYWLVIALHHTRQVSL